jgi:hypothetical protein
MGKTKTNPNECMGYAHFASALYPIGNTLTFRELILNAILL